MAQDVITDPIHDFYCRPRTLVPDAPPRSIYEIWERGEAFHDSITPSSFCPEYRTHMVLKILSLVGRRGRVFSIGCGNGFVEAGLSARGIRVQAIDCNAEAVALTAAKGVDASIADYCALPPGHFAGFDAIYADGVLGHLYREDDGLDAFFEQLIALAPRPGAWLVFSNDAPLQPGLAVSPHERLANFWLLSREFVAQTLARFGFAIVESYHVAYERPLSGLRNRTICIARADDPAAVRG